MVNLTAQSSDFRLRSSSYYVWCSQYSSLLAENLWTIFLVWPPNYSLKNLIVIIITTTVTTTTTTTTTTSLLVLGDPGRLGTPISVVSVETSRTNKLAVHPLALMNAENWRHETLLLRLVASPWYRTAQCQPSSPRGNSKGKFSGSYAGCLSRISSDPSPRWRKIMPLSAPFCRQVEWQPPRYTLGIYVSSNRLPGLRDMPIGRWEFFNFL